MWAIIRNLFRKRENRETRQRKKRVLHYNCARVHVGGYCGGGTNEDERWMECNYQLMDGDISIKKIRPIKVKGTNSEGTIYTLQTLVLYPKTETATVKVTNGKREFTIQLIKARTRRSTIFKLKL